MNKYYFCFFFFLLGIFTSNAGSLPDNDYKSIYNHAEEFFINENYTAALPLYLQLDSIEKGNANVNFKIGLCYLNAPTYKKKSIPYLENAITRITDNYAQGEIKESGAPLVTYYYLAKAYRLNYEFDKAITMYEKYKTVLGNGSKVASELADVDHEIETCKTGKEFIKTPKKVTITNLGKEINSPYADFSPVVSLDEETIIFTSRRPGGASDNKELNGQYFEDIYISHYVNDKWEPAASIGTNINTPAHESTVNLSADGQKLLIYKDEGGNGNLFLSELIGNKWGIPKYLGANINTPSWETHACFSADNRILYFISDRPGGYGGRDIYKCLKLPNGEWGPAQNLGDTINTKYDEDGIFIYPDGKQISFASKGHNSIGGFDIFTSFIDGENGNWTSPLNMGYPINTPDDEIFLTTTADGKRSFFSSDKEGGFGEKDLYLITLPEHEPRSIVVLVGKILNNTPDDISNYEITITDIKTGEEVQTLNANITTGKFGTTLEEGHSYKTVYKVNGKEFFSEVLIIPKTRSYQIFSPEIPYGAEGECDFKKSSYQMTFKYNKKEIDPNSKEFKKFIFSLNNCLKYNGAYTIDIESSASTVPTKTYKNNEELALIRAQDAKEKVLTALLQLKGLKESDIIFNPLKPYVQGPPYKRDYKKEIKYEQFQYIKVNVGQKIKK